MKITKFATDTALENEGTWVDIGDGATLLVARKGNRRYRDRMRTLLKPHRASMRAETMPDDLADRLLIEAEAETILLGWEGIEDADGNPIAYSTKEAKRLLSEHKDFRALVDELSSTAETFRAQEIEEGAENLRKNSDGGESGGPSSTTSAG